MWFFRYNAPHLRLRPGEDTGREREDCIRSVFIAWRAAARRLNGKHIRKEFSCRERYSTIARTAVTGGGYRDGETPDRSETEDYPLSAVPGSVRQGFWPISLVLLGFTFFSATMWGRRGDRGCVPVLAGPCPDHTLREYYPRGLRHRSRLRRIQERPLHRPLCPVCVRRCGQPMVRRPPRAHPDRVVRLGDRDDRDHPCPPPEPRCGGWEIPLIFVFGLGFCLTAYIGCRGGLQRSRRSRSRRCSSSSR